MIIPMYSSSHVFHLYRLAFFILVFGLKEGKNENYEQKHQGRSAMRIFCAGSF